MVESRSCSGVWDQNNPQTGPEIGSTPSSYRPCNSLYVGKLFSTQLPCREGGGLDIHAGLDMVVGQTLENPIGPQIPQYLTWGFLPHRLSTLCRPSAHPRPQNRNFFPPKGDVETPPSRHHAKTPLTASYVERGGVPAYHTILI